MQYEGITLSMLWGLSEDVLYVDNYAILFCFFKYWYVCVLHSIFFEIFVSEVRYFIHQLVVIVQSIWQSLSLRNYLLVLARRIRAIGLWAKPFCCEKLNKIDLKLFCSCFRHLYSSRGYNLANHRDVLSWDLFSHGSRSSTSRSDLLKLPIFKQSKIERPVKHRNEKPNEHQENESPEGKMATGSEEKTCAMKRLFKIKP